VNNVTADYLYAPPAVNGIGANNAIPRSSAHNFIERISFNRSRLVIQQVRGIGWRD
jgi:hypothetical protein